MALNTTKRREFGDFQTPMGLASRVCNLLRSLDVTPNSIVEPTCGEGSFLHAVVKTFPQCRRYVGFDVNPSYVRVARALERVEVHCIDFFQNDWPKMLDSLDNQILVIGNPPWVTNSTLGTIDGRNLPTKSNFLRFKGIDAITGRGNFDISEWMLMHLLDCLSGREAILAMLCKTTVARKVLRYAWTRKLQLSTASIYLIDAARHFQASVDACLLVCSLKPSASSSECFVYSSLESSTQDTTIALRRGKMIADLELFNAYGHLLGKSPLRWRSGVKHDCARVIELLPKTRGKYENKFGDIVNLESTCLYPMLKSSELMKPKPTPSRFMLITQKSVGNDTSEIARIAPRTWQYLQSYASLFDTRGSAIYRNRPRFSMFGIGPYSFAPWKVATSGFYKSFVFRPVGPVNGKPIVLDDTCYFLPCRSEIDAKILADILNSQAAIGFFKSLVFWDSKRPITASLLSSINLRLLANQLGVSLPLWSNRPQSMPLFDR